MQVEELLAKNTLAKDSAMLAEEGAMGMMHPLAAAARGPSRERDGPYSSDGGGGTARPCRSPYAGAASSSAPSGSDPRGNHKRRISRTVLGQFLVKLFGRQTCETMYLACRAENKKE